MIPSLPGETFALDAPVVGRVQVYSAGEKGARSPALLVHTVNAAASAFEVKPTFESLALDRPVFALDLPGFGASERSDRVYTPRLMTDAVLLAAEEAFRRTGQPLDLLGVSLGCEFVARAALERPDRFRTLSLVSPTGFERRRDGPDGATRAIPAVYSALRWSFWSESLFDTLTRPGVIRYFLERTWGSKQIDEALWAHDVRITKEPGARFAPQSFLSGHLFSADISRVYEALKLPVFVAHGVRGDFTKYPGLEPMKKKSTWSVSVFQTGALPNFEAREAFEARLKAFLDGPPGIDSGA
ncbi:MAG: alpha/beta fold hydrolase [Myxococcaceae bacterium]|nr:alpha/beta fold hydrolase [Myxococcaceae bacterium]